MRRFWTIAMEHFELAMYLSFWAQASALAFLVGRPALGALGLLTVAPFAVAYAWRVLR